MRSVPQRLAATAAIALGLLLGWGAGPAAAYCRAGAETEPLGECAEEPSVPRLRWTRGCIEYAFDRRIFDRLTDLTEAETRETFEAGFGAYSEVDCGRTPFEVRQSAGTSEGQRHGFEWDVQNESVVVGYTRAEWRALDYDEDAAAATLLFFDPDTGEIYDADIVLNLGAGTFTSCDESCEQGQIDLLNTVTHEAGHYLGLGHSTAWGATMAPYGRKNETEKRTLEEDDRQGYCALDLPEPDEADEACEPPIFYEFEPAQPSPASGGEAGCTVSSVGGGPTRILAPFVAAIAWLRRRRRPAAS